MIEWRKDDSGLSVRDIERRQPFRMEPHCFVPVRRLAWLRCRHCGLLALRNDLTAWCIKAGCNAKDHPEHASRVRNARPKAGVAGIPEDR